ncbi:MAG: hypothetical protein HOP22_00795 [Nitrospiraceae bacterium]|nr:hypothetical protein [Nitrospiraceae bacterium]
MMESDARTTDLARIIHDGSLQNRAVALRDGHAKPGTDTLLRVCAWCLSPSEPGQAPSRPTEPVPEQYVEGTSGEPARRRLVAAEALMNIAGWMGGLR